jgi:hypothetical protein
MKLQKQLSRKVAGKEYPKYVLTVPPKCIDELGWEKGTDLQVEVVNGKLVVDNKKVECGN